MQNEQFNLYLESNFAEREIQSLGGRLRGGLPNHRHRAFAVCVFQHFLHSFCPLLHLIGHQGQVDIRAPHRKVVLFVPPECEIGLPGRESRQLSAELKEWRIVEDCR